MHSGRPTTEAEAETETERSRDPGTSPRDSALRCLIDLHGDGVVGAPVRADGRHGVVARVVARGPDVAVHLIAVHHVDRFVAAVDVDCGGARRRGPRQP